MYAVTDLTAFTNRFLGYGNLAAPIWFIGLEEGGGQDLLEIERRVTAWRRRGSKPTEYLAGFHRDIGVTRFFDPPRPVLQRTWCALMKTLQAYRGAPLLGDALRQLQAGAFGAGNGAAALLELLALPSKDKQSWIYTALANQLPILASRATYEAATRPSRIQTLRTLVAEHSPAVVVCYGMSEQTAWRGIIGAPLGEMQIGKHRCLFHRSEEMMSAVVPHPGNARSSAFWIELGETLRVATLRR